MDANTLKKALRNLRMKDSTKVLKSLKFIRKHVNTRKKFVKLRKNGFLKHIKQSLHSSKSCIDVSLDILGNCFVDPRCASKGMSIDILSSLNYVLERYPDDDNINRRVFRIIRNLCLQPDHADSIVDSNEQIVTCLVKFLEDAAKADEAQNSGEISKDTILTGLQAMRQLVNSSTASALVTEFGALGALGMLMVKYSASWTESEHNKAIMSEVLKTLLDCVLYHQHGIIVWEMTAEGANVLESLPRVVVMAPETVIKMMVELKHISYSSNRLCNFPIRQIFDALKEALDGLDLDEFETRCEEYIRSLYLLVIYFGSWTQDMNGDIIELLVPLLSRLTLESSSGIKCCLYMMLTLWLSCLSQQLERKQVKCRVVDVIIEKLRQILGFFGMKIMGHPRGTKRKEPSSESESPPPAKRNPTCLHSMYPNGINESPCRNDSEPVSCTSGLSSDSRTFDLESSSDDDCSSRFRASDGTAPVDGDASIPAIDLDEYSDTKCKEERVTEYEWDSYPAKLRFQLLMDIVGLLKRYTEITPPLSQLAAPEILVAVLTSCVRSKEEYCMNLVDHLLTTPQYILACLQTYVIPELHELFIERNSFSPKCCRCLCLGTTVMSKFHEQAESEMILGHMVKQLLMGDDATKRQMALVFPYVVTKRASLANLLVNCGGLDILMELLREDSEQRERAIKSICVLAKAKLSETRLGNSGKWKKLKKTADDPEPPEERNSSRRSITLKLDDGGVVKADRALLCRSSDFFDRMLGGDFTESTRDEVALHCVSRNSLRCLLELAKWYDSTGNFFLPSCNLATHLDVTALCDRFLMTDCVNFLLDDLSKYRMTPVNIQTICKWSLDSGASFVRTECVKYVLTCNVKLAVKVETFENWLKTEHAEEFISDVRAVLVEYLERPETN